MAAKIHLNFVRKADISGEIDEIRRIHLDTNCKRVHIREDDSFHDEVITRQYDFQNAAQTEGSVQVPRPGYSDNIYRYMIDADDVLHLWICCAVPLNTPLPVPDYQIKEFSGSGTKTVWLANGEQDSIVLGGSAPGWVPGALTEQEKKDRTITAVKAWRARKKAWLLESPEYADLIPEITKHLGYWLRAADYAIKVEFTKKVDGDNDAYDWPIIEAIAKEMTKGPLSLDPDGDGAYNVEFFQAFRGLIYGSTVVPIVPAHPNGPSQGVLWLNTGTTWASAADVERQTFTYSLMETQSTRYAGLSATYISTHEYWSS
ncbi:MAG: hypothetical protein OXH00_02680 [Candidatus Poribacteria bacterium]|nr:hypothetical protein [Candidatus Poribacteria bacterium]